MFRPASRRGFLAALGVSSIGTLAQRAEASGTEEACVLTPQSIEGPFYRDPRLERVAIAEDRPGVPLRLRLRVIEVGACAPIMGARVDIWHCDAQGLYSGYPGQGDSRGVDTSGKTFLRGSQKSGADGWVGFETIYPGWYPGRATHVHVKVFLDRHTMLTGQIYFPDALNEFLYTQVPAYRGRRAERSIVNMNDAFANGEDPQRRAFCAVKEERDRYVATLTLAVAQHSDAGPSKAARPPSGPGEEPSPDPREPARLTTRNRFFALVPGLRRLP